VFCSFDPNRRLPVLATPGVLGILGIGKEPMAVQEKELEAVWTTVNSGLRVGPWPFLEVGQRVLVERGPLSGIEGVVTRFKGTYRLAISMSLLQRSIFAEVEREWIRPCGNDTGEKVI
jgi:transcription antitermination factor NusG